MEQWQVGPVPPEYLYSNQAQHANPEMHATHNYQPADMSRRPDFTGYAAPAQGSPNQQHAQQQQRHPGHAQHPQQQQQQQQPQHHPQQQQQQHHQQQHAQQQHHQPQSHHGTPVQAPAVTPAQKQGTPTQAPAPAPPRGRKRPAPQQQPQQPPPQQQQQQPQPPPQQQQLQPPPAQPVNAAPVAPAGAPTAATAPMSASNTPVPPAPAPVAAPPPQAAPLAPPVAAMGEVDASQIATPPPAKKSRTNTPWTPAEELRLKQMRDAGNSWAEIAKTFPTRTEGSVKKHWYKDMHYAEFAEDESQALMNAIKDYENNKWKTIGQKVGKPAKACEQYAKEHFPELFPSKGR